MSQTRRFIQPYKIVGNGNIGTSFSSAGIDISNVDDISLVYEWNVGVLTPTGAINVEVRNGEDCPWTVLDLNPAAGVTGSNGKDNIQITNVSFKELRVSYVRSAGDGTLNVWLTGKGR